MKRAIFSFLLFPAFCFFLANVIVSYAVETAKDARAVRTQTIQDNTEY